MINFINRYWVTFVIVIVMSIMNEFNIGYDTFFINFLILLTLLFLKYVFQGILLNMKAEFLFISFAAVILLPKFPDDVGHYIVSAKLLSKQYVKNKHHDKYYCTFLYTNVDGKPHTEEFNYREAFDKCEKNSFVIAETSLMRIGYFEILDFKPDSSKVEFFSSGCCVKEHQHLGPGDAIKDDTQLRAEAVASMSKQDLKPLVIYVIGLLLICVLNFMYDRLGYCSLILMMIAMAFYNWKFCDSIYTMGLAWLLVTPVAALARVLGNRFRLNRSLERNGAYVVSAQIEYGDDSHKKVWVKFLDADGKQQDIFDPFIDRDFKTSCNAIVAHSVSNYSELKVIAIGATLTPELFAKLKNPVFVNPGVKLTVGNVLGVVSSQIV